jgi:predicted RNA binding protein YcfA (HicA-like mRNA interferase family)
MSPQLPILKSRDVIKALQRAGFYIHHQTGSHIQLKHCDKSWIRITIPFHSGDLTKTVIRSIIRQAELTVQEFLDLL